MVHYLTEELVAMGHEVTLYASGDARTSARLVPVCPRSLRLDPGCIDPIAHHMVMLELISRDHEKYDVLHFHIDYFHFLLSRMLRLPQLTTLHGRLDLPDLAPIYDRFGDMPVVSISAAQRTPLPQAKWIGTVHHGLPEHLLRFSPNGGDYFVFVGRISPEKRVDRAIEIATALGTKIKIAAKVDKADREYFQREIAHLFDNPLVEYLGEVGDAQKSELIGGARALLFPIDWPEPFGLVMIEAMACGTPVIAFRHGSVPEVIDDGVTGFIVDDMPAAIEAASRAHELDRRRVREVFEERFTARRMAKEYLELYRRVAESNLIPFPGHAPEPVGARSPEQGDAPREAPGAAQARRGPQDAHPVRENRRASGG
ncbi:MAG TPA: glycosyltransferase family 4 protein [Planctomycetota bacterium]|nr:glycosyltransferase family 4 protein [Planctomycetota bacterium]